MAGKSKKKKDSASQALEKAIGKVYDQKYEAARKDLEKILERDGLDPALASSARTYSRICQNQLLEMKGPHEETAEALYNWGVYLHNQERGKEALEYFEKALKKEKGEKGYIHYAMAAVEARAKNADKAVKLLSKAVDEREQWVFHAGADPDFREIASNKAFEKFLQEHSELETA